MARIPIYEQQVAPSGGLAVSRAPQTSNAGMQALAQGLDQASNVVNKVAYDKAVADGSVFTAKLAGDAEAAMYADMEQMKQSAPPGGGEFTKDALKRFDTHWEGVRALARNGIERKMLAEREAQSRQHFQGVALQWQAQERVRNNFSMATDAADQAAAVIAMHPDTFEQKLADQMRTISAAPLDPEDKQKLVDYTNAAFNAAYIHQVVQTDAGAAKAFIEKRAKDGALSAKEMESYTAIIKNEGDKQFGRQFADKYKGNYAAGMTATDSIADPDQQQAARAYITQDHSRMEAIRSDNQRAAREQVYAMLNKAAESGAMSVDVPESMYQSMDPYAESVTRNAVAAFNARAGKPPAVSDFKQFDQWYRMPADKLAELNPGIFRQSLANTEYSVMMKKWQDAVEASNGTKGALTPSAMLDNYADMAGYMVTASKGSGNYEEQYKARAQFIDTMNKRLLQEQERQKRTLTDTEMQAFWEPLAVAELHKQKTGVFGTSYESRATPVVMMTDEEILNAAVEVDGKTVPVGKAISPDFRFKAMQDLRAAGITPTETEIARLFLQSQEYIKQKSATAAPEQAQQWRMVGPVPGGGMAY